MGGKNLQTISELLDWACTELSAHNMDMREARDLLSYSLGVTESYLIGHSTSQVRAEAAKKFKSIVRKRLRGAPFAYITGSKGFYGLDFIVTKDVLIPRPETEELIDWMIQNFNRQEKFLFVDVGTGSGCIAVTLAKYFPKSKIIAIDKSAKALSIAKKNARSQKVFSQISFRKGSLLAPLKAKEAPDAIVSNPPYLEKHELGNVPFEPVEALYGGKNGLEVVDELIEQILSREIPNTMIEISPTQEHWLSYKLQEQANYSFRLLRDLSGRVRFLVLTKN